MFYSVVVPVYNKRPHVRRAIESVLAQTEGNFELIVIDDSSTDGSADEISFFADPRIIRLHRDEAGPGGYAARNLGIREARAGWVAFLDADDEWDPRFLETISELRSRFPDARCACTAYWDVSTEGCRTYDAFSRKFGASEARRIDLIEYLRASSEGRCPIRTSAVSLDRALLLDIGLFPAGRSVRGGDNDTWFRAMRRTDLAWSPYRGAIYYRNAVNMTTTISRPDRNPCLEETIRAAISETPRSTMGRRLRFWFKRLANHEKKAALKNKIRKGTLSLADLKGIYPSVEPLYSSWIFAWALLPRGASRLAIDVYKRAKVSHSSASREEG